MFSLRCTARLLERLKLKPQPAVPPPTTRLGDWYANLVAHPEFTFHLKRSAQADLPARATPLTEPAERRAVLGRILAKLGRNDNLEDWVARSPLVAVKLDAF